MTKRERDTRITREQLEAGDYGSEADEQANAGSGMNKATEAALSQRKIVKVKRHIQQTGEVKTDVPNKPAQFKLFGSLSSGTAPVVAAKTATFQFSATPAPQKPAAVVEDKKETITESKNLFGDTGSKKFAVASAGTFGGVNLADKKPATATLFGANVASAVKEPLFKAVGGGTFGGVKLAAPAPKVEEKKPATTSLFGGASIAPAQGSSLFGNLNTVKSESVDPAKKTSLFGGNPTTIGGNGNQKFGLFSGAQKSEPEKKPEEVKTTSLFGGSAPASGCLFGGSAGAGANGATGLFGKPPVGGALFGNPTNVASGTSLFGGAAAGSGLFKFTAPPPAKKEEENEDEVEEGEKSPPIYGDDTTKVEYKGAGAQTIKPSPYTKLFMKHVGSFKVVKPEDQLRKMTNCEVSLEYAETDSKKVFLLVVRQAKKMLLQGTLSAKVSRCRRVEEKSAKNQLKLCVQQTVGVTQKKVIFPFCVVNFSRQEEMINFETEFTKAITELKAQAAV